MTLVAGTLWMAAACVAASAAGTPEIHFEQTGYDFEKTSQIATVTGWWRNPGLKCRSSSVGSNHEFQSESIAGAGTGDRAAGVGFTSRAAGWFFGSVSSLRQGD